MELCLLITALTGLFLGTWSVHWARSKYSERRAWWGRRLFIATLLLLGTTIFLAAILRADGLVPLSLLAGILLVAMLWETPPALQE
jgi:hypothetical protein